jgi:hypothetical protein
MTREAENDRHRFDPNCHPFKIEIGSQSNHGEPNSTFPFPHISISSLMLILPRLRKPPTKVGALLKQLRRQPSSHQFSAIMAPKRKLGTDTKSRPSKRAAIPAVNAIVNAEAIGGIETVRASPDGASERNPKRKIATPKDAPASIKDLKLDDLEESDEEDIQKSVSRPPPVNSDVLPLPWKGRLGYVCMIRT